MSVHLMQGQVLGPGLGAGPSCPRNKGAYPPLRGCHGGRALAQHEGLGSIPAGVADPEQALLQTADPFSAKNPRAKG